MNVLFLNPSEDTAGLGIAMKRAFDAYGGAWHARAVRLHNNYLDYPYDIQWDRGNGAQNNEVMGLYERADVLHIMEQPAAAYWFPGWQAKTIVVQHLGTFYRKQPDVVAEGCRAIGAFEVVDMHDLMRFRPLPWLPDIIDPTPLAAIRAAEYVADGRVRIAHAPTNRAIKSTDLILAAIERLRTRHDFDFDLIERVPNDECLRRKARVDIFIDELTLGYGLNALECWSMGVPVISGVADPETRRRMREDSGGTLPFLATDAEMLEACIEDLIVSESDRRRWANAGMQQVQRFHTPQAVVERAIGYYEQAMARLAA